MTSSDQNTVIENMQELSSVTLKKIIQHRLEQCFNLKCHKYIPFPFTMKRAKICCIHNNLPLNPIQNGDAFLWRDKWITQKSDLFGTDYNLPDINSYHYQENFIDNLFSVVKCEIDENGWKYFDLGCTEHDVVCILFNVMVNGNIFETKPIDIVLKEDGFFDTRWTRLKIPEFTTIQLLEDVFNLPCYGRSSVCDGNTYGYSKFAMIIRFAKSIDLYPKELYEIDQKWLRFDTVIKVVSKITSFEFLRYLADNNEKKLFEGTVKDCHRAFDRKDIIVKSSER